MSNIMASREIGGSGIHASAVGLGTWAIGGWMWGGADERASIAAIQASIDAGVTLIDTAPAYGMGVSEEIVGKAIAGRRDNIVIATKCGLVWHTNQGRYFFDQDGRAVHRFLGGASIIHEVEQSLRRLGTDYIDIYITHWQDATTPIAETMETLEALKRQGKVRAIGASNLEPEDLRAYLAAGQLDVIQERFNMLDRATQQTLLPLCAGHPVSIQTYSSLALGLLSGKIGSNRAFDGDDQRKNNPLFSASNRQKVGAFVSAIRPVTEALGATVAQLVIAWTLRQPGITFALFGARNLPQAIENAGAGAIRLSNGDLAAIDDAAATSLVEMDR